VYYLLIMTVRYCQQDLPHHISCLLFRVECNLLYGVEELPTRKELRYQVVVLLVLVELE
jgi:hypothetical protein